MPSFDIVSEVNQVEVRNAVDQANKEISTRFDFKGSDARVEHKEKELTLFADDDFKLKQVTDVMLGKLTRRGVDVRSLKFGKSEKMSGDKVKQVVTIRVGIEQDLSKKIVKMLKDSKLSAGQHQGDAVLLQRQADELQTRGPGKEVDYRFSAAVRQFPRLTFAAGTRHFAPHPAATVHARRCAARAGAAGRGRSRGADGVDTASVSSRRGRSMDRKP
jgi:uncharacterized protein YajQ (UPF0234 family)